MVAQLPPVTLSPVQPALPVSSADLWRGELHAFRCLPLTGRPVKLYLAVIFNFLYVPSCGDLWLID